MHSVLLQAVRYPFLFHTVIVVIGDKTDEDQHTVYLKNNQCLFKVVNVLHNGLVIRV